MSEQKSERLVIRELIRAACLYDIVDGSTPDDIISKMMVLKKEFEGRQVFFDLEPYGYDGGVNVNLYEKRLETDKEYNRRTDQEEEIVKKKTDAEYKKYLELKKKFKDRK